MAPVRSREFPEMKNQLILETCTKSEISEIATLNILVTCDRMWRERLEENKNSAVNFNVVTGLVPAQL